MAIDPSRPLAGAPRPTREVPPIVERLKPRAHHRMGLDGGWGWMGAKDNERIRPNHRYEPAPE